MNKFKVYLSTLNFILPLCGYQLITTWLLPSSIDNINVVSLSQSVTIPYRGFTFILSFITFIWTFKSKIQLNFRILFLILFWFLLLLRICYDLFVRTDFLVMPATRNQILLYSFVICFFTMMSVIKSIKFINFNAALKALLVIYFITLIGMLVFNKNLMNFHEQERFSANIAMSTLGLGQFGSLFFLALVYALQKHIYPRLKWLYYILLLAALFITLRAGSRGPFLALGICAILMIVLYKMKDPLGAFFLIFSSLFVLLLLPYILDLLSLVAPVLQGRLENTIQNGDLSGRQALYQTAWENFANSPILGSSFAIHNGASNVIYSHNMILDSFMGLGFFGGLLFIFILLCAFLLIYKKIKYRPENYWIYLFLLIFILSGMSSGAFYMADSLSVMLAVCFLYDKNVITQKITNK